MNYPIFSATLWLYVLYSPVLQTITPIAPQKLIPIDEVDGALTHCTGQRDSTTFSPASSSHHIDPSESKEKRSTGVKTLPMSSVWHVWLRAVPGLLCTNTTGDVAQDFVIVGESRAFSIRGNREGGFVGSSLVGVSLLGHLFLVLLFGCGCVCEGDRSAVRSMSGTAEERGDLMQSV